MAQGISNPLISNSRGIRNQCWIEGIRGHLGHSSDLGSRQSKQRVSSSSTHGALSQKDASQGQNPDTVNMWEAENMSVASQGATGGSFNRREETVERPLEGRLCQCAHIMQGHRKMSSKNRDRHLERKFRKPGATTIYKGDRDILSG